MLLKPLLAVAVPGGVDAVALGPPLDEHLPLGGRVRRRTRRRTPRTSPD
jgi:hypothetical protein